MKIVIIETDHAQISISLSEVFEGHEQHFFTPEHMQQEMQDYSAGLFYGQFHNITDLQQAEQEIINSGLDYTIFRASYIIGKGDSLSNFLFKQMKK